MHIVQRTHKNGANEFTTVIILLELEDGFRNPSETNYPGEVYLLGIILVLIGGTTTTHHTIRLLLLLLLPLMMMKIIIIIK
jgi:hypothetical protein